MKIVTQRLVLREIDPERDFEPWAESMADENTVRYLGLKPMSRPEAWRNMAAAMGHWAIRGYGMFSLEHRETGEWLGRVGPYYPEGWPGPEVGWTLSPRCRGRGYATEAASASLEYVFRKLAWPRVIHCILEGNDASAAVAERLGSRLLRTQQGLSGITSDPVMIYGQDHAQWEAGAACRP